MAWTPTTFRARWTEFGPTSDAVITAALAEAATRVDTRLFKSDTDSAVGHYAAHLLVTSPQGAGVNRMASEEDGQDGDSTYLAEYKRLAKIRAGGPWTMGQATSGWTGVGE